MAAMTYSNFNLHFGIGYPKEKLPDNWTLVESPEDWAIAVSPEGQEYFLAVDAAYPRRKSEVAIGRLKVGEFYIDTKSGVIPLTA